MRRAARGPTLSACAARRSSAAAWCARRQFVALPMKWALADLGRATQLVASQFGVALAPQPHIRSNGPRHAVPGDTLNANRHPSMEHDGAAEAADFDWLRTTFFEPDTAELARLFSRAMAVWPAGLALGGATAGSDEAAVLQHLRDSW